MRKKLTYFLLIVFLASIFSGCKKNVHEANPDFIGDWKSCGTCFSFISIRENSSGSWVEAGQSEECDGANISGTFRLGKDKLKLKTYTFKVIEYPTWFDSLNTGCGKLYNTWKMQLKDPKIWGGEVNRYYKQQ